MRRCRQELERKADPCVAGIVQAFVAAGDLEGLDASCLAETPELSFALRADEL